MSAYRVQQSAALRIDQIYRFTCEHWGEAQAEHYVRGMFERFAAIAERRILWRRVPAELGIDGYVCRYEKHFIYWKVLENSDAGIVTVLHERMHRIERLRDALGET